MGSVGKGAGHALRTGEKVVRTGRQARGQDREWRANRDVERGFDSRSVLAGVERTGVDGLALGD